MVQPRWTFWSLDPGHLLMVAASMPSFDAVMAWMAWMACFEHYSDDKYPTDQSAGQNGVASSQVIHSKMCSKSAADSLASTRISATLASSNPGVFLRWTVIPTKEDHLAGCVPYPVVCFLLASTAVSQCWHPSYQCSVKDKSNIWVTKNDLKTEHF